MQMELKCKDSRDSHRKIMEILKKGREVLKYLIQ